MTQATPVMAALDRALAAKIDAEAELDLLWERLAEERGNLAQAEAAARTAGLALARSGSDADRLASREALALKAEIERTISHLTDTLIPEAEEAKARAADALDVARRTACADEAEARAAAAADRMAEVYEEHRSALLALQSEVAEADAAVRQANDRLPTGRLKVADVEERLRDLPHEKARLVSDGVVDVFVFEDTGQVVPERDQDALEPDGESGFLLHPRPGGLATQAWSRRVVIRPMRRIERAPERLYVRGDRIAQLVIPPLRPTPATRRGEVIYQPLGDDHG